MAASFSRHLGLAQVTPGAPNMGLETETENKQGFLSIYLPAPQPSAWRMLGPLTELLLAAGRSGGPLYSPEGSGRSSVLSQPPSRQHRHDQGEDTVILAGSPCDEFLVDEVLKVTQFS